MLNGKTILIGITGGIAAYKICELIRMFKRANANVKVICTKNAMNFVTKLTLENLSKNKLSYDEFDIDYYMPEHISLADEGDIMIIAPATADIIGKIANGICDNLLTSVACAFRKPIIIAPAMNTNMWENNIVQENVNKLTALGYHIVPPESGDLACGTHGVGRLCELEKIFDRATDILNINTKLNGKKIVITSGGTIEDIDPVRYISNYSSGKMGQAIADAAHSEGADVVLISTRPVEKPYRVVKVKSALDMSEAVKKEFHDSDCIIMTAAIADYRVKQISDLKIKKTPEDELHLELIKNPDILKELWLLRHSTISSSALADCAKDGICHFEEIPAKPILVGFCAESENLKEYALNKIQDKGCDFLIANDISRNDIGFDSDFNEVLVINSKLDVKTLKRAKKEIIARQILEEIYG